MATTYVVRQGDYLSKIAKDHGFSDYRVIWDHPNNSALKSKRKTPNVLFPGDSLFIPDSEVRVEPCSTDKRHRFTVGKPVLKLTMVLEDIYKTPIANARCVLLLGNEVRNVTTDPSGRIDEPLPPGVDGASLRPLLVDPGARWDRPALTTYLRGNHGVYTERWHYIRYRDGAEELYDRRQDPQEWVNLAGREALREWLSVGIEPPQLRSTFLIQLAWADQLAPDEESRYRALSEFVANRYRVSQDVAFDLVSLAHHVGANHQVDPLLIIAVTCIIIPWISYVYESATGLTMATRRSLGEISSPQHLASTRRRAIGFTIFFGPVAGWCWLALRRRNE